jgi:3-dehydroquinate synthase
VNQSDVIHVELGERRYPIYIGEDLLKDSDLLASHLTGGQVVVVTNETVAPLYLSQILDALASKPCVTVVTLPDGEQYKTWETLGSIFDQVLADRHNRTTTFIALGGGVVGDITGFAAACYQRGVDFIQVPTTLLAQVDSSVGGKTAVNHPLGKNMIGAFYQPKAVLIDTRSLSTLGDREFAAGMAEVIKYGLIADSAFYEWLLANKSLLKNRDPVALKQAITRSCELKAEVVASDERESGRRAILNLGHTFGHAIETFSGYGAWLHGEAVAAGMVLALKLSSLRGAATEHDLADLEALLSYFGLPTGAPVDMSLGDFMSLMALDKKVQDGRLRFVLLEGLGSAIVVSDVTEQELSRIIA